MIRLSRKSTLNKKFTKLFATAFAFVGIISILGVAKAAVSPSISLSQNTNISNSGQTTLTVTGSNLADSSYGVVFECNDDRTTQPWVPIVGGFPTIPIGCQDPLTLASSNLIQTTSSGNLPSNTTFIPLTGTLGPSNGGTTTYDKDEAADFKCPPTPAQVALGDTCVVYFGDQAGNEPFSPIIFASGQSLTTTTTSLSLKAARVNYGSEQTELIKATITPVNTSGTVVVSSKGLTVCTITISPTPINPTVIPTSNSATCVLSKATLNAGSYSLLGSFNSGTMINLKDSVSSAVNLTVAKAASKTTLKASVLKLTYGKEQTEKLTVSVTPTYATGTVTIKSGSVTLCKLIHAVNTSTVSCYLTKSQLSVGTHKVSATFSGNTNVSSSSSGSTTLTVVKS